MTRTITRRGPYVAPTVRVPSPDLHLTTEGLAFEAGKVTSWTAEEGGFVFLPTSGYEPLDGSPVLNGRRGALFDVTGGRLHCQGPIVPDPSAAFSTGILYKPFNAQGAGNREYLFEVADNEAVTDTHLIAPHQTNDGTFNRVGVYTNPWHHIESPPRHRLQRLVLTYDGAVARAYRNGVLLGASPSSATTAKYFRNIYLGASYGSPPVTETFRGSMFDVGLWCGRVLTAAQVERDFDTIASEFDFDPADANPEDVSPETISLRLDSRGRYKFPTALFDGTNLSQWLDYSGLAHHAIQSTSGMFPVAGDYIAGNPTIRIGGTKWMGLSGPMSSFFGAGVSKTYDVKLVGRPRSITSTHSTPAYLRDVIIGDLGDFWSIHLFNNNGVPSVGLYHYALGTFVLARPVTIGEPILVHAWYDGTNINLRVNDGEAVATPCGPVSDLDDQLDLGYAAGAVIADFDIADITIRNTVNVSAMNSDRAYYGREFVLST